MIYPNHLTVIVPHFRTIEVENSRAFSNRLIFMPAFAMLVAMRQPDGGVLFDEHIEIDSDGACSIELLMGLAARIDPSTALAGWRLDQAINNLVRLPRDSDKEQLGKLPLMKVGLALGARPIDVAWFDERGGAPTLRKAISSHGLDAALDDPSSLNRSLVISRLSARVRAIWAAIAERLIPDCADRAKAFASFDSFMSKEGGTS